MQGDDPLDDLRPETVQALLTTRRFGRSLEVRALTESTNDDARAAASAGAVDGHTVVADSQRRGRGSRGRHWDSPPGTDLYLSIVAKVARPLADLPALTLALGVGVAEAVEALLPGAMPPEIKWPNDVWLAGKKVAGVLVEGASLGQTSLPLVIGIGLNVNRQHFPADLDTAPTSLKLTAGHSIERSAALAVLLARVEHWFDRFVESGPSDVVAAVNARLCLRGQRAACDDLSGVVEGVAASGALRFSVDGKERELYTGRLRPAG